MLYYPRLPIQLSLSSTKNEIVDIFCLRQMNFAISPKSGCACNVSEILLNIFIVSITTGYVYTLCLTKGFKKKEYFFKN